MERKYLIIASRCVEFCFSLALLLGFGLLQSLTLHLALDAPVSCMLCSAAKYRALRAPELAPGWNCATSQQHLWQAIVSQLFSHTVLQQSVPWQQG